MASLLIGRQFSPATAGFRVKVDARAQPSFTVRTMRTRADITEDPVGLLTPRERECLRLVDQHLSSKQIARQLGMSKTSVDTYCDRARRKLGVGDRYEAARRARTADVNLVPIESGQDAIRTDNPSDPWLDDPAFREAADGRLAELRQPGGDRKGLAAPPGDRRLRDPLADLGRPGRDDPNVQLGAARAAARGFGGYANPGFDGPAPGFRDPEAGAFQAFGNGAEGNPLHDVGSLGRELQARARYGIGRNDLSPAARLGAIVGVAIITALAFGAMLAGLHALQDLATNLIRA
ncbi:helix-turn-helix domain-containing protein [Phenylobacterium hankyongense]|uniref:helix-turn-helix domain-containing protein n=1 Tax=Phenylobacterium hankyongense TaxID=1813876 RepID=UPI001A9FDEE3|nr:helix-turn-helix transcriptional regulator [Phenylobacterium hankyongense]